MVARHWCKQCGCWVQGDPKSIRLHESQWRHKNRVQALIRRGRREKDRDQREKLRLQRELGRIESAASNNATEHRSEKTQQRDVPGDTNQQLKQEQSSVENDEDQEDMVEPSEVLGQYTMDGVLFLQGNWHEDLLVSGTPCEAIILNDDDDELVDDDNDGWKMGYVHNVLVKREGINVKREYWLMLQGETEPKHVNARDIRLRAPLAPPINTVDERDAAEGWETVAVRAVGDDKREATEEFKQTEQEEPEEQDTYTTFNPFGGKYKGFEIDPGDEKRVGFHDPSSSLSSSRPQLMKPKFKKRRKKTS